MELEFVKLHGAGNDFIFVDDFSREIDLKPDQVASLCDRHFGIGADGMILVRPSARPECTAYMHYINSDGSLAQMCGNGVRCFAKYLVDRGFVPSDANEFVVDTDAGPKRISFAVDHRGCMIEATVDMGKPILDPALVPAAMPANEQTDEGEPFVKEALLSSPWGSFAFTCVSMGNPHAICFLDDLELLPAELFTDSEHRSLASFELVQIGAYFESHEAFPEKANIEFAVVHEDNIEMRVFERGCGETLACGTGACATGVAAALTGRSGRENDLRLRGGTLHIKWDEKGSVFMSGPAAQSFSGTVRVPD